MKIQHALFVLAFAVAACAPVQLPDTPTVVATPPEPPTATVAPTDTAIPITDTPVSEATPTATTKPEVWEIWFRGFSCEGMTSCSIGPGQEIYYYSIKSDGSELKQLLVNEFPSSPAIPDFAPPALKPTEFVTPPRYSPDGQQLIYQSQDLKLYLVDLATSTVRVLFDPAPDRISLRPYCWLPDGRGILFVKIHGGAIQPPSIHRIGIDSNTTTELLILTGFEGTHFGDCSPTAREIVFQVDNTFEPEKSGLYRVDVASGEVTQILGGYSIDLVRTVSQLRSGLFPRRKQ